MGGGEGVGCRLFSLPASVILSGVVPKALSFFVKSFVRVDGARLY